jgi:hypothetical protein
LTSRTEKYRLFLLSRKKGVEMTKHYNGFKKEYRPRSGQIAVELGFITAAQLKEAINEQLDDDLSHSSHRFLVEILLEKGWITREQVDIILDELFKDEMRSQGKL